MDEICKLIEKVQKQLASPSAVFVTFDGIRWNATVQAQVQGRVYLGVGGTADDACRVLFTHVWNDFQARMKQDQQVFKEITQDLIGMMTDSIYRLGSQAIAEE